MPFKRSLPGRHPTLDRAPRPKVGPLHEGFALTPPSGSVQLPQGDSPPGRVLPWRAVHRDPGPGEPKPYGRGSAEAALKAAQDPQLAEEASADTSKGPLASRQKLWASLANTAGWSDPFHLDPPVHDLHGHGGFESWTWTQPRIATSHRASSCEKLQPGHWQFEASRSSLVPPSLSNRSFPASLVPPWCLRAPTRASSSPTTVGPACERRSTPTRGCHRPRLMVAPSRDRSFKSTQEARHRERGGLQSHLATSQLEDRPGSFGSTKNTPVRVRCTHPTFALSMS